MSLSRSHPVTRFARAIVLSSLCFAVCAAESSAQRAVFVVRHAEKLDQSEDAALSAQGLSRAKALAELLRSSAITHIFTTQVPAHAVDRRASGHPPEGHAGDVEGTGRRGAGRQAPCTAGRRRRTRRRALGHGPADSHGPRLDGHGESLGTGLRQRLSPRPAWRGRRALGGAPEGTGGGRARNGSHAALAATPDPPTGARPGSARARDCRCCSGLACRGRDCRRADAGLGGGTRAVLGRASHHAPAGAARHARGCRRQRDAEPSRRRRICSAPRYRGTRSRAARSITSGSAAAPTHVLLWSQMHGDEPTATSALFDLHGMGPSRARLAGRAAAARSAHGPPRPDAESGRGRSATSVATRRASTSTATRCSCRRPRAAR